MNDIVKRLQGSLKYDAFNGSYNERAICISQVEEAISLIDSLRAELDEIREAWEPIGYNLDFSNASDCEHLDYSSFSENVTFGDLRKLAKLIGKEKE